MKRERLIVGVITFLVFLIVPISGPGFGLAINNFGIVMGAGALPAGVLLSLPAACLQQQSSSADASCASSGLRH